MLRKSIIFSVAAAGIMVTPAFADGEPSAAPASGMGAVSRWSGFYIAGGGGMGKVDQSVSGSSSELISIDKYKKYCHWVPYWPYQKCSPYQYKGTKEFGETSSAAYESDDWKGFGTLQFGVDHLIHDRVLIGAFADVDLYSNAESAFSFKDCDLSVTGSLDLQRVWNVGGRLGVLAHPDFLIYAVGGYSRADIESATQVDYKSGASMNLTPKDSMSGYFVGGGGEWMIHKNLSLKVEYRWARYRDEGASDSASLGPYAYEHHKEKYVVSKAYGADADYDLDIQTVRGALVLRFDRDEPAPAPLK